jgi:hypothetical protein
MRFIVFYLIFIFQNIAFSQLFGGQIKTSKKLASQYPAGSVFCVSGPTAIVDVINPTTGKTWMDRNLGASQLATSSSDANSYGDLYQWGRGNDGHQCRNSSNTISLSSMDQPGHGDFILSSGSSGVSPYLDWRSPQNNNLWQGINGVNNPCPLGYRLPTLIELTNETNSWSTQDVNGAFNSLLKLPAAGARTATGGNIVSIGTVGQYNCSVFSGTTCSGLYFMSNVQLYSSGDRAFGRSIRCIKN